MNHFAADIERGFWAHPGLFLAASFVVGMNVGADLQAVWEHGSHWAIAGSLGMGGIGLGIILLAIRDTGRTYSSVHP